MTMDKITAVAQFQDFENKDQDYARDIWLLLYRCNGMNHADMLRMKWTCIKGDYLFFIRMKTENTKKLYTQEIVVPISPEIKALIEKVGVKESPYILGLVNEGYSEDYFNNKKDWEQRKINTNLKYISKKLNLSDDLKIRTARDNYANTLKQAGRTNDQIGEMMGHSNSETTRFYLASLDMEKTRDINQCLL